MKQRERDLEQQDGVALPERDRAGARQPVLGALAERRRVAAREQRGGERARGGRLERERVDREEPRDLRRACRDVDARGIV